MLTNYYGLDPECPNHPTPAAEIRTERRPRTPRRTATPTGRSLRMLRCRLTGSCGSSSLSVAEASLRLRSLLVNPFQKPARDQHGDPGGGDGAQRAIPSVGADEHA